MSRYLRLSIALVILLAGLALLPYASLSSSRIGWEQFAQVYAPQPDFKLYFPFITNL